MPQPARSPIVSGGPRGRRAMNIRTWCAKASPRTDYASTRAHWSCRSATLRASCTVCNLSARAVPSDSWLRGEASANDTDRVPTRRIYQFGPHGARDSRDLRAALAILAERGRARMEEDGRRRAVAINPALLAARQWPSRIGFSPPEGAATVATVATLAAVTAGEPRSVARVARGARSKSVFRVVVLNNGSAAKNVHL